MLTMAGILWAASESFICPHCQQKGGVATKFVSRKSGVSGPKIFLALLTFGISLLFVGISSHETAKKARCSNCNAEWWL